jgi:uncharacterized protein (TIGR03067 family)
MRVCVILAAVFALGQVPTPKRAEDKAKELEQLRGSWQITKIEPLMPDPTRMIFDGDKLTVVFADQQHKNLTIMIDPAAKPAQMDSIEDLGKGEKVKTLGIYEVSGDTLRICVPRPSDGKRPAEFKAGEGVILATLKREKK